METTVKFNFKGEIELTFDGDMTALNNKQAQEVGKIANKQVVTFKDKETAIKYFSEEILQPEKAISECEREIATIKIDEKKYSELVKAISKVPSTTIAKFKFLDDTVKKMQRLDQLREYIDRNKKEFIRLSNLRKEIENLK
jgi:hypothetical protein